MKAWGRRGSRNFLQDITWIFSSSCYVASKSLPDKISVHLGYFVQRGYIQGSSHLDRENSPFIISLIQSRKIFSLEQTTGFFGLKSVNSSFSLLQAKGQPEPPQEPKVKDSQLSHLAPILLQLRRELSQVRFAQEKSSVQEQGCCWCNSALACNEETDLKSCLSTWGEDWEQAADSKWLSSAL